MLEGKCRECEFVCINDENDISGCEKHLLLFDSNCKGYKLDEVYEADEKEDSLRSAKK